MSSLQSIMWPGALVYIDFTLLAYAPEQICLPHCADMFHCTTSVVYIQISHVSLKKTVTSIYHPIVKYVPAANMLLKYHIYATCPNYSVCTNKESRQFIYETHAPWNEDWQKSVLSRHLTVQKGKFSKISDIRHDISPNLKLFRISPFSTTTPS